MFRCEDKPSCSIKAVDGIFGDTCSGTDKYLEVTYKCRPAPPMVAIGCEGTLVA